MGPLAPARLTTRTLAGYRLIDAASVTGRADRAASAAAQLAAAAFARRPAAVSALHAVLRPSWLRRCLQLLSG